jgi:hypothetical protein
MTTNVILATCFISLPPFPCIDFTAASSMNETTPLPQAFRAIYPCRNLVNNEKEWGLFPWVKRWT